MVHVRLHRLEPRLDMSVVIHPPGAVQTLHQVGTLQRPFDLPADSPTPQSNERSTRRRSPPRRLLRARRTSGASSAHHAQPSTPSITILTVAKTAPLRSLSGRSRPHPHLVGSFPELADSLPRSRRTGPAPSSSIQPREHAGFPVPRSTLIRRRPTPPASRSPSCTRGTSHRSPGSRHGCLAYPCQQPLVLRRSPTRRTPPHDETGSHSRRKLTHHASGTLPLSFDDSKISLFVAK